jgi:hypothetical protein
MLFCQLGRADSLRDICNGLACCLGRLVHLGIAKAPRRSTLSYANEHRPAALFEDLFSTALARFREQHGLGCRKHKFRFKNKLLSLDLTTISLCLTMFTWAQFRRAKGGVKAHVQLDHDDYLRLTYFSPRPAERRQLGGFFHAEPGSIVAVDRGYSAYALFGRWTLTGVFFVTRMKDNAVFTVEKEFEIPANRNIRADQIVQLSGVQAQADCPGPLHWGRNPGSQALENFDNRSSAPKSASGRSADRLQAGLIAMFSRFQSERFGTVKLKSLGRIRATDRLSLELFNPLSHFVPFCRPGFRQVSGANIANRSRRRAILC